MFKFKTIFIHEKRPTDYSSKERIQKFIYPILSEQWQFKSYVFESILNSGVYLKSGKRLYFRLFSYTNFVK